MNKLTTIFFILLSNSYGQDFSYETTQEKSLSKYQRINFIEKHLENFNKEMGKFKSGLDKKDSEFQSSLNKKLEVMNGKIKDLKSEIDRFKAAGILDTKKSLGSGEEIEKLKEKIKSQDDEIANLKKQFNSLESVLKSLNEFLNVKSTAKPKPNG
ncbi:MAG: hypothetical protein K9K67_04150 [Bacteriovoracaceae bacterium]|nr:hypothetical protein [Bacteriovoracaceae bacterium]